MKIPVENIIESILNGRILPRSRIKHPCSICYKSVKSNHKAVQCDVCDLWVHIGCNGTTVDEYELLKISDDPWVCLVCNIVNNLERIPFTCCDNFELRNINNSNSMKFLESLPNAEIVDETAKFLNVSSNEASIEIPSKSCSKYYSVEEFQLLNMKKF